MRKPPPPVAVVNGIYSNTCCRPIVIRNGLFLTGSARVQFSLRNMKYGLEATPVENLTVQNGRVQVAATNGDPIYIVFDDDQRGFTLLDQATSEFHFRR